MECPYLRKTALLRTWFLWLQRKPLRCQTGLPFLQSFLSEGQTLLLELVGMLGFPPSCTLKYISLQYSWGLLPVESVGAYGNPSLCSQQVCTNVSESIYSQFAGVLTLPCWFASWMNISWHIWDRKWYPNEPKTGFSCCRGPSCLIFSQNKCCCTQGKGKKWQPWMSPISVSYAESQMRKESRLATQHYSNCLCVATFSPSLVRQE